MLYRSCGGLKLQGWPWRGTLKGRVCEEGLISVRLRAFLPSRGGRGTGRAVLGMYKRRVDPEVLEGLLAWGFPFRAPTGTLKSAKKDKT